jgi:uncharacterized protein (DUF2062 family)
MARKLFRNLASRGRSALGRGHLARILRVGLDRPRLWYLNRHTVAWAVSVGLFMAFVPVPFQMLLAALAALGIGCNLPIAVATVWVSNPITIPPLFYGAYRLGAWLLGTPYGPVAGFSWDAGVHGLLQGLGNAWQPFLLGCLILGLLCAVLGHALVRIAWRLHVAKAWHHRQVLRRARAR